MFTYIMPPCEIVVLWVWFDFAHKVHIIPNLKMYAKVRFNMMTDSQTNKQADYAIYAVKHVVILAASLFMAVSMSPCLYIQHVHYLLDNLKVVQWNTSAAEP